MEYCKEAPTPVVYSFFENVMAEENKSAIQEGLYQKIVGPLLYLSMQARPDIYGAASFLSRFQKTPIKYCHTAAKRVFRYLKRTKNHGLIVRLGASELNIFVDSDFATD